MINDFAIEESKSGADRSVLVSEEERGPVVPHGETYLQNCFVNTIKLNTFSEISGETKKISTN